MQTWIEINKKALKHNLKIMKGKLGSGVMRLAVVKGNAYGHGMVGVAEVLQNDVDYFGVFDFIDGVVLRKNKIKNKILVLCPAVSEYLPEAIKNNIELTVTSVATLKSFVKYFEQNIKTNKSKEIKIHLNIETGLGRDGFVKNDRNEILKLLKNSTGGKKIKVVGLFTHFMGVESIKHKNYTARQVAILIEWKQVFMENGYKPILHSSGTAGALLYNDFQLDMCRFGIGLYGLWPSKEVEMSLPDIILKPALTWYAKIVEVKELGSGVCVGYDCTYKTNKNTKIAVLPVAYFDGIPRAASNKGYVIVKGVKVPIIGRVMMNMVVVDITGVAGVKVGDIAIIIGESGKSIITVEDWADWSETINYEVVTRINERIPRIFK